MSNWIRFKKSNNRSINKCLADLNFEAPEDYKEFLINHNGGHFQEGIPSINIPNTEGKMIVGALFGVDLSEDFDLKEWNEEYEGDLIQSSIIIGSDYGSGLLLLILQNELSGVFFIGTMV